MSTKTKRVIQFSNIMEKGIYNIIINVENDDDFAQKSLPLNTDNTDTIDELSEYILSNLLNFEFEFKLEIDENQSVANMITKKLFELYKNEYNLIIGDLKIQNESEPEKET